MKPATFAPTYACVYPELAEIARQHGYALAAHGSMARDFDLVCIPWAETISDPRTVVDAMANRFSLLESGGPPTTKEHGRIAYSLTMARGFGEWCIDLSFMQSHREAVASLFQANGEYASAVSEMSEAIAKLEQQAQAGEPIPENCDVRKILIDVVPDMEGDPVEVYAESVADVEERMGDMGRRLEDYELGITVPHSIRGAIAKKDAALLACVEAVKELVAQNETSLFANSVNSRAMQNARDSITQAQEALK